MDTRFTPEEQSLREMYHAFAEKEIRPHVREMESGEYDEEIVLKKIIDMGCTGIIVPEEYGGIGGTYVHYAICTEELSYGDGSMGMNVSGQTNMCLPLLAYGTEAQKQTYVKSWVTGEKKASFALTEPSAGSDAGSMKTTAILKGDNFVINGTKMFISGAANADFFETYLLLKDETNGSLSPICVMIDKDKAPGLTVGKKENLMGMLTGSHAPCIVYLDNVVVPKENLVGKVGEGFHLAMSTLDGGRLGIAAVCTGMAQYAIDETVKYTKARVQFGNRISQFQNTQFKLAELQTAVNAARLLTYDCAVALDHKEPAGYKASMAKYFASFTLNNVVRECLQLHGGYGYSKEYPIEKLYRDAKITEIYEGTSEIQKKVIAKWMGVK